MRIGFFSDFYLPRADGIAFSIESFRTELEAMGHDVFVITPRPSFRFKEPSKRIIRFPAVKGLFFDDYMTSIFFPPQAERKLDKLKLDIIHYHTPGQLGMLGAFYALRHDIPLVTTYHTDLYEYVKHYPAVLPGTIALSMLVPAITGGGMDEFRTGLSSIKPESSIDKWNQKIVERSVTMIHNHCDLVISPSKKIERQLKGWNTKTKLVILPTGVDKITATNEEIAARRKQYGITSTDHVVLFVGRMGTEKNVGLLLAAFDIIAKSDSRAKLLLVGIGEDIDDFIKLGATSPYANRIIFAGFIDHAALGSIYGIATVFAFPSMTDTQGLVLNEAARAGLPIVMIDHNVTEVVRNGKNGFYARSSARSLANQVLEVLKDPVRRKKMGQASIELADGYGVHSQAERLLTLYRQTVKNHKPRQRQRIPLLGLKYPF
jgi:glycosyltransferase involved in cell wall biosynthesis